MKTLTINYLTIQFDVESDANNLEATTEMLDSINDLLQNQLPDSNPQIFYSGVQNADIEEKQL